jgi:hypothetical protein
MNALVNDALKNLWCVTDQTNQAIIKPARLTPIGGARGIISVGWLNVSLPDNTSTWHVYQIGQVGAGVLNLLDAGDVWENFIDCCNAQQCQIDAYVDKGVMLHKSLGFYRTLSDKNLIVAIKVDSKFAVDLNKDDFYIRVYRNRFYQSGANTARLKVKGEQAFSTSAILAYQLELQNLRAAIGNTPGLTCYVNGIVVNNISLITAKAADYIEYVYDPSVYKTLDFRISTIPSFVSVKDNVAKWLLITPDQWDGKLEHCYDVDCFLVDPTLNKGVYVHKNIANMMRMVTGKDYSIVSTFIKNLYPQLVDSNTGTYNLNNMFLRVMLRNNGGIKTMRTDARRLPYLMSLPVSAQFDALVGADSSNAFWNAPLLEDTAFDALMSSSQQNITPALVESVYGYSGATASIGNNIKKTYAVGPNRQADVDPGFTSLYTAYEYSSAGLLLGRYVASQTPYVCQNNTTTVVEFINGQVDTKPDEFYNTTVTTTSTDYNYRFYCRNYTRGVEGGISIKTGYKQAIKDVDYTVDLFKNITWVVPTQYPSFVRTDKKHIFYTASLAPTDGLYSHTLAYIQNTASATTAMVPFGEYDFWVNNKPLIEGVDYIFKFPTIILISKKFTDLPSLNLSVRLSGHCHSDLTALKKTEVGFTYNGLLSADNYFELHRGKSLRIVCDNALQGDDRNSLIENSQTGTFTNGAPYEIREMVNGLNGHFTTDPYVVRKQEEAIEASISAYLTRKLPQVKPAQAKVIATKTRLLSPFICKVIRATIAGNIAPSKYAGKFGDDDVRAAVAAYTYLLDYDPINPNNRLDENYVTIEPMFGSTSTTVTPDQFAFINNVVRIYAKGKVVLTPWISL